MCTRHGSGATSYFRPVNVLRRGPGGQMVVGVERRTYYVCNVGSRGRGRPGSGTLSDNLGTTPTDEDSLREDNRDDTR